MKTARRLPGMVLIPVLFTAGVYAAEPVPAIREGSVVTIVYSMTLPDGTVVKSAQEGNPLVYNQGRGELLPAVEEKLAGARAGEVREFTLPPEQAFGEVRNDALIEVALDKLPEDARREGAALVISNQQGQEHVIRVKEIKGDKAVLDLNHPLAGKTIHFKIRILSIR